MNHQLRLIERMKFDFSLLEDERGIIDAIISHERKTGVEVKKFCWTDGFPGAIEGIVGDTIGIHSDLDRVLVKFMKDDLKLEETNWEVFK